MKDNSITVFQYVGEVCRYLVNSPPLAQEQNSSLRFLIGSGMGIDVWQRFRERFGSDILIVERWGATDSDRQWRYCCAF